MRVLEAVVVSVVLGVASVTIAALVFRALPADYFRARQPRRTAMWENVAGWLLIVTGLVLTIPGVPGQGLLTVLAGVILADFPKKLALERWLMRKPAIFAAANVIRKRFGRPPFEEPMQSG